MAELFQQGDRVRHVRLGWPGEVTGRRTSPARPYLVHWDGEHETRFSACAAGELELLEEERSLRAG